MRALVAGTLNTETSVPVESFPLDYHSTRFVEEIRTVVSGVGWNVATALHVLGDDVRLLAFCGDDSPGRLARETVASSGVDGTLLPMSRTPQSVILVEPGGRRAILLDLAGVQDVSMPLETFRAAAAGAGFAMLANVNWTRPLLQVARRIGIPIATDLHDVAALDNPYDTEYLESADIVFLSDERLPVTPEEAAAELLGRSPATEIICGLGAHGALLARRGEEPVRLPAPTLRPVRSTIGGGDALAAGYCHFRFARNWHPFDAMRAAITFASWKVGSVGGSEGFLTEPELERLLAV